MRVSEDCPHCGEEIEFQTHTDWQDDGVWRMNVETIEELGRNCECVITEEDGEPDWFDYSQIEELD